MSIFINGVDQALVNIVEDLSPQLGANLDSNSFDITGIGHIGFLACQDASAGANDFDDYEEGLWTPILTDATLSACENQTFSTQAGRYTKIGRMIHVQGRVVVTSLGCLTVCEPARIIGLPFTSLNSSGTSIVTVGPVSLLAIPNASESIFGQIIQNSANIRFNLWDATVGSTNMPLSVVSADGDLIFSGVYEIV